jgi:phage protein U
MESICVLSVVSELSMYGEYMSLVSGELSMYGEYYIDNSDTTDKTEILSIH